MGSGVPLPIISGKTTFRFMQGSTKTLLSRYLPLLAWLAFISFASNEHFSAANTSKIIGPMVQWLFPGMTPENRELVHFSIRKLSHILEYAILAVLAARAFRTSERARNRWFIISLVIVITYALLDEYHQTFVPSRTPSFHDSLIDIGGGLIALLGVRWRGWWNRSAI